MKKFQNTTCRAWMQMPFSLFEQHRCVPRKAQLSANFVGTKQCMRWEQFSRRFVNSIADRTDCWEPKLTARTRRGEKSLAIRWTFLHIIISRDATCNRTFNHRPRKVFKSGGASHGERGARAYKGGLGAEPPAGSRGRAPGGESGKPPWSWKLFLYFAYKKKPKFKDWNEMI